MLLVLEAYKSLRLVIGLLSVLTAGTCINSDNGKRIYMSHEIGVRDFMNCEILLGFLHKL
jgi:hypothetical protein